MLLMILCHFAEIIHCTSKIEYRVLYYHIFRKKIVRGSYFVVIVTCLKLVYYP